MAMIINEESKEYFIHAGQIAGKALNYACKTIKMGMPVRELLDKVELKINDLGAGLAFPAQASINDIAAHFCPKNDDIIEFQEGDMVKIDIGAEVEGFIGDNARTVYFGKDPELLKLLEASKKALQNATKLVRIGTPLNLIGAEIEKTIMSFGFNPIRNLSGHGLGVYSQHDSPTIPNYDNNDTSILEENEMIAIEPFATTGAGLVKNHGEATLFSKISDKNSRNPFARDVLKVINKFKGLPFSFAQITKNIGSANKARIGLQDLNQLGILHGYPPLIEKSNGIVSQHEHSFLVADKTIITTMVDDDE